VLRHLGGVLGGKFELKRQLQLQLETSPNGHAQGGPFSYKGVSIARKGKLDPKVEKEWEWMV